MGRGVRHAEFAIHKSGFATFGFFKTHYKLLFKNPVMGYDQH